MAIEAGFWEADLQGTVARMNASLCQKGQTADLPAHDADLTGRWYYDAQTKLLRRDAASAWEDLDLGGHAGDMSHANLAGLTSDNHHAQTHAHSTHTSIGTDDHHAQTHAASDHTNVTRTLFYSASEAYSYTGSRATFGSLYVWEFANAVETNLKWNITCPSDFASSLYASVIWTAAGGSGNIYGRVSSGYGAIGETYYNHSNSSSYRTAATTGSWHYNETDSLSMSYLALGDFMGMQFSRDATDASDTLEETIYVVGLLLSYTATQ